MLEYREYLNIKEEKNRFLSFLGLCKFIAKNILWNRVPSYFPRKPVLQAGFLLIFSCAAIWPAKADTMDTIIDTLSSLTCETQGVGDLLRSEFSHTCIPAPFFTFLVANVVSPGLYANTMLRLKINDEHLFPGACARENRIEFNDQKLSFAMCNNIKLATQRTIAIAKSAVYIAEALFTGQAPWSDIKDAWNIPETAYHNLFIDKREGDSGTMVDIGIIPIFPWKVIKDKDKMCVATQSFSGWIPIGCKYIKEPYPVSIYSDFMNLSPSTLSQDYNDVLALTSCSNAGSCYARALNNSKTGIVMSGPLIECVKEMVAKLMVSNAVCNFGDAQYVLNSPTRSSSALFQFQVNMHRTVAALLTLYVIIFGFRIVLSGNVPPKTELINFGVKFLFVVYFSVGINIRPSSGNDLDRLDGMVQWAFPFLLDGMTQMASWVISASPSELCRFYSTDYVPQMSHMALWDSLDCRISHYLGLDMMQTMIVDNASRNHDFSKLDILSFPIPPYIYLLVPAVMSGNFTLISLALMYPLMVISVGAFVVSATVVCIISIVILGMLAPLFVPMYLFNYTKGYFESWVKLLISFMLQPMVAVVFMTTMLSVYDFGFYGSCKYNFSELGFSGSEMNMSTLSGGLASYAPGEGGGRAIRYYYLDNDWTKYTDEEKTSCINSLGFILNNPLAWLLNTTETTVANAAMPWINDASGNEEKKRFDFLNALTSSPGMFFNMLEVLYEKIKTLALALLTACFTLYLMQHFSETLADFAADMTEGVSVGGMAIKPQTLYKAGMGLLAAGGKGKGKGGSGDSAAAGKPSRPRAGDGAASGAGPSEAGDKVSVDASPPESRDKVSSGENVAQAADKGAEKAGEAGGAHDERKKAGSSAEDGAKVQPAGVAEPQARKSDAKEPDNTGLKELKGDSSQGLLPEKPAGDREMAKAAIPGAAPEAPETKPAPLGYGNSAGRVDTKETKGADQAARPAAPEAGQPAPKPAGGAASPEGQAQKQQGPPRPDGSKEAPAASKGPESSAAQVPEPAADASKLPPVNRKPAPQAQEPVAGKGLESSASQAQEPAADASKLPPANREVGPQAQGPAAGKGLEPSPAQVPEPAADAAKLPPANREPAPKANVPDPSSRPDKEGEGK